MVKYREWARRHYAENRVKFRERAKRYYAEDKSYHLERKKRLIAFKGRRAILTFTPRTGKCLQCGIISKRTNMHHALGYFTIFPWFGIKELCVGCHDKTHRCPRGPDGRFQKLT